MVGMPFETWQAMLPKLKRPYVTVVASVDPSGHVASAQVDISSGNPDFDAAGVAAMRSWTFVPASDGCKPAWASAEYAVSSGDVTFDKPCEHDAEIVAATDPELTTFPLLKPTDYTRDISVTVSIDATGRLMRAKVTQSTGRRDYDAATLRAALLSTYFPPVHACQPSSGSYMYTWTFEHP